jgi:hypothetical protein
VRAPPPYPHALPQHPVSVPLAIALPPPTAAHHPPTPTPPTDLVDDTDGAGRNGVDRSGSEDGGMSVIPEDASATPATTADAVTPASTTPTPTPTTRVPLSLDTTLAATDSAPDTSNAPLQPRRPPPTPPAGSPAPPPVPSKAMRRRQLPTKPRATPAGCGPRPG